MTRLVSTKGSTTKRRTLFGRMMLESAQRTHRMCKLSNTSHFESADECETGIECQRTPYTTYSIKRNTVSHRFNHRSCVLSFHVLRGSDPSLPVLRSSGCRDAESATMLSHWLTLVKSTQISHTQDPLFAPPCFTIKRLPLGAYIFDTTSESQ